MSDQDKTSPVAERFKAILEETAQQQNGQKMAPVRIILPDGRELVADRIVAHIVSLDEPDKYRTLIHGGFQLQDFMQAKTSLTQTLDQRLKEDVLDYMKDKLRQAGIPVADIEMVSIPAEFLESLRKTVG